MAQILEHSRVCCAPAPSARELCLFSCLLASVLLLAHADFLTRLKHFYTDGPNATGPEVMEPSIA